MSFSMPLFEVADIIRIHREELQKDGKLNAHQKKVFTNISKCRTKDLGYHIDLCDQESCGHMQVSYNSCRDRHCPKCNGIKREKWIVHREEDLLPVKYFHTVFTIPETLNRLFIKHPVVMYNLLFSSVWQTVKKFGFDPKHLGAKTGMICILHTWGQNLAFHPHIHCIIPGGGLTKPGKWKNTRGDGKYLYPVKALNKVFRGIFSDGLIDLDSKGIICLVQKFVPNRKYLHPFYKKKWVVFAKLPMYNAKQVINYIGRYTHRIAISNHRLKSFKDGKVTFSWFNYKTSKTGEMELSAFEFLRRFSMHILPSGFMKIRHYGILSSRNKAGSLKTAREMLEVEPPESKKHLSWQQLFELCNGHSPSRCPICKKGTMVRVKSFAPKIRGSPELPVPAHPGTTMK